MATVYEFDVALSFAGEDRDFVERVAKALRILNVRVYYDRFETANVVGKNLRDHLHKLYESQARFCVVFISAHYEKKAWTILEHGAAQERSARDPEEYIIPARFDDTVLPGISEAIAYIDLRKTSPEELAAIVAAKIHAPSAALLEAVSRWRSHGRDLEWVLPKSDHSELSTLLPGGAAVDDHVASFIIATAIRHGDLPTAVRWTAGHAGGVVAEALATCVRSPMRRVRYMAAGLLTTLPPALLSQALEDLRANGDPHGFAPAIEKSDVASRALADSSLTPMILEQVLSELRQISDGR